jgi:hypothetical protein
VSVSQAGWLASYQSSATGERTPSLPVHVCCVNADVTDPVVFKEYGSMRTRFKTLVTAALSLILGAGASGLLAAPISVAQEVSTHVGAWQISQNAAIPSPSSQCKSNDWLVPLNTGDVDSSLALKSLTVVKFTGTEAGNAISNWDNTTAMDDLVIDDPAAGTPNDSMLFSPAPELDEVRAPLAVWQSLTGLMFVILFTLIRPTRPATIAN